MGNDKNTSIASQALPQAEPICEPTAVSDRRNFLMKVLKQTGKITIASGVLYGITYLTSKSGNTAGAK